MPEKAATIPWKLYVQAKTNHLQIRFKAAFPRAAQFFKISLCLKLSRVTVTKPKTSISSKFFKSKIPNTILRKFRIGCPKRTNKSITRDAAASASSSSSWPWITSKIEGCSYDGGISGCLQIRAPKLKFISEKDEEAVISILLYIYNVMGRKLRILLLLFILLAVFSFWMLYPLF